MTHKEYVIRAMECAKGDDLERAQYLFKNLTPEQMAERVGPLDRSRQEILDGYVARRREHEAAIEWLKRTPSDA